MSGKGALRSEPATVMQLRAAEAAFSSQAMVAPPAHTGERALLGECLRSIGAIMAILQL